MPILVMPGALETVSGNDLLRSTSTKMLRLLELIRLWQSRLTKSMVRFGLPIVSERGNDISTLVPNGRCFDPVTIDQLIQQLLNHSLNSDS